jgi:4-amino-4-deoxy-L-arabinose transferase-like glycosyltransferase
MNHIMEQRSRTDNGRRPSRSLGWAIAGVVLSVHAALLLCSIRQNFLTIDEPYHVMAGISYWQTGEFSEYRVNPPLTKMLTALPVMAALPWTSYRELPHHITSHWRQISLSRLPGILWSICGALVIFFWGRDLYGEAAGYFGMALWCFDPNILAHASLATPDVPATVVGVAATYAFWKYLKAPSWRKAWLVGILLGLAELTKFTLLILYAIWPALYILRFPGRANRPSPAVLTLQGILILWLSLCVINLGYMFRGTGLFLSDYVLQSRALADTNHWIRHWVGDLPVPLPSDYVNGIAEQRGHFEVGQPSYLGGQWRDSGGWWYYYLYASVVKIPLGTLGLLAWALVLSLTGTSGRGSWRDEAVVWLPAAIILMFVSSQTGFSKHFRYALPILPFVIVGTSRVGSFIQRRSRWAVVAIALLCWTVGSSLAITPHWLSYFNELAGGPENGHSYLIDSNIDWGQDVFALKQWVDEHPEARPLRGVLFQMVDLAPLGLEFKAPPPGPTRPPAELSPEDAARLGPRPGWFILSVSYLRGKLGTFAGDDDTQITINHDSYRYFLEFNPVARVGYSVYIYHITPAEAESFRSRMGLPPLGWSRASVGPAWVRAPIRGNAGGGPESPRMQWSAIASDRAGRRGAPTRSSLSGRGRVREAVSAALTCVAGSGTGG